MRESLLLRAYHECEWELLSFLGRRLGSRSLAADIAHDLYLKLLRSDEDPSVRDGRAYLFRMASNLAIDHQRRERRRAELIAEADAFLTGGLAPVTPEQAFLARDELARLERALAELPEVTRRIFHLCRIDGVPQRDVAAMVGLSPTAVFKHLRKAVDHLARVRDP